MDLLSWRPDHLTDRQKEFDEFRKRVKFDRPEFIVSTIVNGDQVSRTLADTGCTTYGLVSEHFARKHQLERLPIKPRAIDDYKGPTDDCIKEVARISLDAGGNHQDAAWLYVVPRLGRGLDMILGLAWMDDQQVYIDPNGPKLRFVNGNVVSSMEDQPRMDI